MVTSENQFESESGEDESEYEEMSEYHLEKEEDGPPIKRLQALIVSVGKQKVSVWNVPIGSLYDLFALPNGTLSDGDGTAIKLELLREDGYPTFTLINLMRDIVRRVALMGSLGITHWKLQPCCFSISVFRSPHLEEPYDLSLWFDETCFAKGESLDSEAPHLLLALGRLLLFCFTGGSPSAVEQARKDHPDLTALKNIPEAMELMPTLLDSSSNTRSFFQESLRELILHPLFWQDWAKFNFICEASLVVNRRGGILLDSLVKVASDALCGSSEKWDEHDGEKIISILRDLELDLYKCHYTTEVLHESEYENERKRCYMRMYPRLFFEVYKVMRDHDAPFITKFLSDHLLDRSVFG